MIVAIGINSRSKDWVNTTYTWEEFSNLFKNPIRTKETVEQYKNKSKTDKRYIKDVGGFLGGEVLNKSRKIEHIKNRHLLCFDIDKTDIIVNDFIKNLKVKCVVHSTHGHVPNDPRIRILIPLSKPITKEEYPFVSRKVAKEMGILDILDITTHQANRLMFWASCPSDGEYIYADVSGYEIDPGKYIYDGWQNEIMDLPEASRMLGLKQADPEMKEGVIGAFCKEYSISETIEKFIPAYVPTDLTDRYTYSEGSSAGGVITYENKWSYSFHSTDPSSMQLCNSFDLVRLHLFNGDNNEALKFCASQERVGIHLAKEEFKDVFEDWMENLEYGKNKKIKPTIDNIVTILKNTLDLSYNEFTKKLIFEGKTYKNSDDSKIIRMLESKYNVYHEGKTKHAIEIACFENSFHPVRNYLKSLTWDGIPRLDTLLINYFGADDHAFNREAIRKTLVASCKRVFEPGCEVQHVLVLRGIQDLGKSTFFRNLCHDPSWFSDSLTLNCVSNTKDAGEQLLGRLILEIPEVTGMRKAEVQAVRSWITRNVDSYRRSFGRVVEDFPRECILVASTNEAYLQDLNGNRRWWTIMCKKENRTEMDRDQIWAEAYQLYLNGESLKLSPEAWAISKEVERENIETDERLSFIEEYLNTWVPGNWYKLSTQDRINILSDELAPSFEGNQGAFIRKEITTQEIWCELFKRSKCDLGRRQSNDIVRCLISLGYTERGSNTVKPYGKCVTFKKPAN